MLVACSACHKRFEAQGYRDVVCPSCGGIAQTRPCPRCELPLQPRQIHDLVLDECNACRGIFVDAIAKQQLAEADEARGVAFYEAMAKTPEQSPALIEKPHLACPDCGAAMQRKLSSSGAGVVIDICTAHGSFYDVGELHKILTLVRRTAEVQALRDDTQDKDAWPLDDEPPHHASTSDFDEHAAAARWVATALRRSSPLAALLGGALLGLDSAEAIEAAQRKRRR